MAWRECGNIRWAVLNKGGHGLRCGSDWGLFLVERNAQVAFPVIGWLGKHASSDINLE